MTDLTALTTPFGLLDRETQAALKAHGGPYQMFSTNAGGWTDEDADAVGQFIGVTYRVKPVPPKPREWWIHPGCFPLLPPQVRDTRPDEANGFIHVREVLPE